MLMRFSLKTSQMRVLTYFKLEENDDRSLKEGVFLKFGVKSPIINDLSPAWYADLTLSIVSSISKDFS